MQAPAAAAPDAVLRIAKFQQAEEQAGRARREQEAAEALKPKADEADPDVEVGDDSRREVDRSDRS